MPNEISGLNPNQYTEQLTQLLSSLGIDISKLSEGGDLPPASSATEPDGKDLSLPVLSVPAGGLSLDSLISAIGDAVRRQAIQDGVASLELKGEQQAEINQKQLDEIKEQLEKMREKSVLDGFLKAFQIIGAIVGAIASVATIAVGVMTANPLLIAAGVISAVMVVDSVVSVASDGKYSIMAGMTELGKAMGMSDSAAQWFAMGFQIALCLTTVGLSIGAAFTGASAAANAAVDMTKTMDVMLTAQKITNLANAGLQISQGGLTIGTSVVAYQATMSQVSMKELEAILERIRQAIELDRDMVEAELKRANELMEAVKEIVDGNIEVQGSIMTAPPLA